MSGVPTALAGVLDVLRCPTCADALAVADRSLRCTRGHAFDVARQGYVNLSTGRGGPGTGDTAAMVAARTAFLERDHFGPIADAVVAAAVLPTASGTVLDVAGGTGYYLAAVLDAVPEAHGICLDLSSAALRRAARAHPQAAAVGADAWQPLPVRDGSVSVALSIFGPRTVSELVRVLKPGGRIVVASPAPEHLAELIAPMRMLAIDEHKAERQASAFADVARVGLERVTYRRAMTPTDVAAVVGMGPTAAHRSVADIAADAAALPAHVEVTVSVDVSVYRTGDT